MHFPKSLSGQVVLPDHESGEPLLSVIIPCFNEQECIPDLLAELIAKLDAATNGAWEIILVDDGSYDLTCDVIQAAHQQDKRVRGLILSRNFGHQSAIFAGLAYAAGQFVGVMDVDLQD